MPAGSLFTLLDDIATILDDVSVLTKNAAAKTVGILGDDLALNAQQVTGVASRRELPVVWAVAKGSLNNKLIMIPLALLISTFATWAVTPLLMLGGIYLCFEGVEKLVHPFLNRSFNETEHVKTDLDRTPGKLESEEDKIKGAIRTDFVLSAEIITITLGTVAGKDFSQQLIVLSIIGFIMTAGVYGVVAAIVKLDDLGLYLIQRTSAFAKMFGRVILWFAPFFMKFLSIAGTVAMFLVGGGIITHGLPWLYHPIEHLADTLKSDSSFFAIFASITPLILNGICGLTGGALALLAVIILKKTRQLFSY
jgi:predicted DNA repair protein MutK